ncbi:MAG: AraC family transcriptional regulator [Acidobacteriaceae bacterium]|nr:AraC family transcriptional regulator [Acidobacteriaceae bacterium]
MNRGNLLKNRRVSGPDGRAELRTELARKVASFVGSAESLTTDVPGLTLYRYTAPTRPAVATYEPSLAVVVQGRKQVELGANTFVYDGSKYLLTSLDLPVVSRVIEATPQNPYLCLRLKLEMGAVREILAQGDFDSPSMGSDVPAMTTAEITVEFLSAIGRVLDLLQTPADIPFLSRLLQRELIYRILKSAAGQRLRAIATAGDQSFRTAKVTAFIKANFTKTLRVEDLAQIAGMSLSTLHHHFRVLTSMSPLQYQKQLRLQAAQRMLIDAASAAFSVGYESASQFNREYSRFFGLPPIKHLRGVRPARLASATEPSHHQNVT